ADGGRGRIMRGSNLMGWMPPPDGIAMCHGDDAVVTREKEASMSEVSIIGAVSANRVVSVA
ncbi:hypothetical protein, partial [Rhodosalinus sp.]|uniref:hypothetical protein n=1 Tax=Rhodosalinus sp. TaxID=2047741 RepID=UPI00397BE3CC